MKKNLIMDSPKKVRSKRSPQNEKDKMMLEDK